MATPGGAIPCDRIRREHEGLFVNRRRDVMVLTAIMLSLLVICWLLWDMGLH
jgi:hypothetical protein